jgi:large subunit ribosomal protein L4
VVFGPSPRSYTFKINRKEKRAALRSALSLHADRGSLAVFDTSVFDTPSTKQAVQLLADWDVAKTPTLVVLTDAEAKVAYSFRNLERTSVLPADGVGVTDIVGAATLLLSQAALDELTRRATA